MKIIRDPIHGDIPLGDMEVELIDTEYMQHLRYIKQNGLCYLVYPAMNSTRFEHSLGVCHLAGRVCDVLGLDEEEKQKARIAGILHDIGHCAFSHMSDTVLDRFGHTHEDISADIIKNTEISDIIRGGGFDPAEIAEIISGNGSGCVSKIISSEIDVDKMDYLIRDSYYAGVAYGVIDLDRIINTLKIEKDEIIVKKGGLIAVESLLIGRNMMYETVYRHHTKRIAERMLISAAEAAIEKKGISFEDYRKLDDNTLVGFVKNAGGYSQEMVERIERRHLFKRLFKEHLMNISDIFVEDMRRNKKDIENKICDELGIERGYILIDIPDAKFTEFKIRIEFDEGLHPINEISELAKTLEKYERERLNMAISGPAEVRGKLEGFDAEKYIQYKQKKISSFERAQK